MAINTPKPRSKSKKGAPPPAQSAPKNLEKKNPEQRVALNFAVPPEFKKEFKGFAVDQEKSMLQLLMDIYDFYKEKYNENVK